MRESRKISFFVTLGFVICASIFFGINSLHAQNKEGKKVHKKLTVKGTLIRENGKPLANLNVTIRPSKQNEKGGISIIYEMGKDGPLLAFGKTNEQGHFQITLNIDILSETEGKFTIGVFNPSSSRGGDICDSDGQPILFKTSPQIENLDIGTVKVELK